MERNRRQQNKTNTTRNECLGCECSNCKNNQSNDVNSRKSRVTIFGQLGLTEDDRYVLNCAATLNDKPIQTNYMDNNMSFYQNETNRNSETKATQATQVNFNFSNQKPVKGFKNKTVQCCCNDTNCTNMVARVSETECEDIELKQCKSPIVVISVYPRQDSEENIKNSPVKIIHHQNSPQNKIFSKIHQVNNAQVKSERKPRTETKNNSFVDRRLNKSRSPSPVFETVNKAKYKNTDSKTRTNIRPNRTSPLRQASPDKSANKSNEIQNTYNTSKYITETNIRKEQHDIRNSNKEQVKKALVDTFLKNNKLFDPKEDTSKITVDINGDKEQYNVLFEQRNFDTGLTVRKTLKTQSHKRNDEKNGGKSKKKLLLSENDDKECCKNKLYTPQCRNVPTNLVSESGLKVKDSLEICHRRDGRDNSRLEQNPKPTNLINSPSKHFRGDNCSLINPDERDKEIRKLLGVLRDTNYQRYQDRKEPKICPQYETGDCCIRKQRVKEILPSTQIMTIKIKKEVQKDLKFDTEKIKDKIFYAQTKIQDNNISLDKKMETRWNTFNNIMANHVPLKNHTSILPCIENENKVLSHKQKNNEKRSITLTKKQYEKVKRILKQTVSTKLSSEKRKRYSIKHCNVVSIGNIKVKRKIKRQLLCHCEVQTDVIFKCVGSQYDPQFQNKLTFKESDREINDSILSTSKKDKNEKKCASRHVMSSMEIRYASVGYMKHVSMSSMQFGKDADKPLYERNAEKEDKTLRTIYKGPRKCVTPNLGTSAFSLNTKEDSRNGSNYSIKPPPCSGDFKMKKPFLQRLLSCLVMRSRESSDLKDIKRIHKLPIQNNSLDSYFISTSLGALEMSSTLYDTSASFYSNHSIIPINKTKRGFFNSVRGFLTKTQR
ncbi:uncharacterized protein LOC124533007 [Vanessa cardui]|uniref:uncharacterized protein LOC124533007 n=1 Tax=Vanessa cardui TaxID=171605 RepID=UPI001F13E9ED|nr:uncharacterized protein LOC124533007 [Vanessa cardui]